MMDEKGQVVENRQDSEIPLNPLTGRYVPLG